MNIFQRYEKEFKELVDAAYKVTRKRTLDTDNTFAHALAGMMRKIKNTRKVRIDRRDIEQQLALLWLEWHRQYHVKKPKTHLKNYLLRRSVWGLRDWLRREMTGPRSLSLQALMANSKENKHLFDLYWLLNGDKEDGPLHMLTPYERYLLFLRHVCGLTIDETAQIVHKCNRVVRVTLIEIISKIRSSTNAEADTSRPCDRGDGVHSGCKDGTDRFSGD